MTRLLVSVRDADEAAEALRGGAALIDVKEPRYGALGAADPSVWSAIREAVDGRVPTSVALGELLDPDTRGRANLCSGFQFAKVGLAWVMREADWAERWRDVIRRLPEGVRPVAVAYADHAETSSPPPELVLRHAVELRCAALLVDTYQKDGRTLLDHWPLPALRDFGAEVQRRGLWLVVGGALSSEHIPALRPVAADYLAVRGAACIGARVGRVSWERVAALVERLEAFDQGATSRGPEFVEVSRHG